MPTNLDEYPMEDVNATLKGVPEVQADAFWDRLPQQWPLRAASQPAADDLHLGLRLQQGQVGPSVWRVPEQYSSPHQAPRCTDRP